MSFDFNDAPAQRTFDLIPEGTVCLVVASLRPGQAGPGGWLRASGNNASNLMADFEFTIDGGPHDRAKFWTLLSFAGGDPQDEKQHKTANSTRASFRAMLESAYGLRAGDDSPAAMEKRKAPEGYASFDGLKFCCKVAIEKGSVKNATTGEMYADKNKLGFVLTPDDKDYINPGPQPAGGGMVTAGAAVAGGMTAAGGSVAAAAPAAAKPSWAS